MPRRICIALLWTALACGSAAMAQGQADLKGNTGAAGATAATPKLDLDRLIARHAAANHVPEALVRRVIKRESRGNPRAISKGNYGLMQIRLGTARALGYRGGIEGLLDADTNMTYAVKYLAGAYRAAEGDLDRAVHYYAAGYYYVAKRKGFLTGGANPLNILAPLAAQAETVSAKSKAAATAPMPRHRPAGIELVAAESQATETQAAKTDAVSATAEDGHADGGATEPVAAPNVDRFTVK